MEMQFLNVEGKSFAYYEEGEKTNPAIVLLHGWPENSSIWEKIIPALTSSYYVLAIDLPGLGESDAIAQHDTGTVANWILKITRALGLTQFNLVSHDIGSWVASTYALLYPEDLDTLVLIDAGIPGILPDAFFSLGNAQKAWHFYFHAIPGLPELLVKEQLKGYLSWFFENKSFVKNAITADQINRYTKQYENKLTSGFDYYRKYEESVSINRRLLRKLPIPVLTIGGRYAVGDKMQAVAEILSDDWHFREIDDCGHFVPEEQPEELIGILEVFLKKGIK
jgi:pimeloyl-ACP methyl ester carboxylesterase